MVTLGWARYRCARVRGDASFSRAYHPWRKPPPRYVVLLGDATSNFKDYLGTGVVNQLPALIVKTSYLRTASDLGASSRLRSKALAFRSSPKSRRRSAAFSRSGRSTPGSRR